MPGKFLSCSLKEQLTCHNMLPLQKIPFRCQNTIFKRRSLHRHWTVQSAGKPFLLHSEDTVNTLITIALHKNAVRGLISRASTPSPLPHAQIDRLKSSGIVLSQKLPRSFFQLPFSCSLILLHTSTHYTSTSNFICDANPHGVLL